MALIRCATFNVLHPSLAFALVHAAAGSRVSATTRVQFQEIHSFNGASDGANPSALLQAADGKLYGITAFGGSHGQGTFYTMTPAGAVTVLHMFSSALDGVAYPGSLVQAGDGNFYGVASQSVFRVTPLGNVTIAYTFPPNLYAYPFKLIQGPDGNLYGVATTHNPAAEFGGGLVFRLTLAGLLTTLRSFPGDTDYPIGLTIGTDGNIYGTTAFGAFSFLGGATFYKMTLGGAVTMQHVFLPDERLGELVEGLDGNFYGVSCCFGAFGNGAVVRMTPAGVVTVDRPGGLSPVHGRLVHPAVGDKLPDLHHTAMGYQHGSCRAGRLRR
jgi:uncharacterized repeat protein (TIGR03803 family)